ncbi:MAG: AMP-binding protein, partial [Paludibacteraceae bacterium]|nr:AMP-binding protein [Paludibacteraceae bacterium]
MLERFVEKTQFTSQADFEQNFKIKVPENFNFGYDVLDAWAAENPTKRAMCWTNDHGAHIDFTYADLKDKTDRTASYFMSLGIGKGDKVLLILKRRYEFWFSILALHKIGAVVIPATHLLTGKDIVYRCHEADIKAIVCVGEKVVLDHVAEAKPDCPTLEHVISVGPLIPEGFEDFTKGIENAAPFVRPEKVNE